MAVPFFHIGYIAVRQPALRLRAGFQIRGGASVDRTAGKRTFHEREPPSTPGTKRARRVPGSAGSRPVGQRRAYDSHFRALIEVDPGFVKPSEIQTFRVDIPYTQVKEPERVVRIEEEILHKIEAVPGVSSVSLSMSVPLDGNDTTSPAFAKDRALLTR